MLRRSRVHLDRIPLHIVQRGHNREPCFFGEEDYSTYLHWLGKALKETSGSLHAYALMSNHVHLLLTPKNAATVPKLVISLGRRYVQYINRPPVPAYGHIVGQPLQVLTDPGGDVSPHLHA